VEDLLAAVDVLACEGLAPELRDYAARPLAPSLNLHLHRLDGLLMGSVDRLIHEVFRKPPDYQKELFALHMWNTSAHDELDAASKVCHRCSAALVLQSAWHGIYCIEAAVFGGTNLLHAGSHPLRTNHLDKPGVLGMN
jgi:hypothetical protein